MTDKQIPDNNVGPFGRRQGPPRSKTVGGSVTADEKDEIVTALDQAGFRSESDGVRMLALAFVHDAAVRDAVHRFRQRVA